MKRQLLIHHKYKKVGWLILIPATILGLLLSIASSEMFEVKTKVFAIYADELFGHIYFFDFIEVNIINTAVGVLIIIGGLLVGFSKEKREDEYISSLRLNALLWSVLVNYLILLFMFLFVYGIGFLMVIVYNLFTILIIFIVKFNFDLYRNNKTVLHEK